MLGMLFLRNKYKKELPNKILRYIINLLKRLSCDENEKNNRKTFKGDM